MTHDEDIRGQLQGIKELYEGTLEEHGAGPLAVGWRDARRQRHRYRTLTDVIDTSEPVTVNDLGCGYGGLFRYLVDDRGIRLEQYFGYDISQKMLSTARSHIDDPRAELIQSAGITNEADYSIACGTLFNKLSASDEEWTGYLEDTLRVMAEKSRRGLAFNLNSIHVDWRDEGMYYGDPLHFFEFCRRELSPLVALRHDYYRFEWSILVRMGAHEAA